MVNNNFKNLKVMINILVLFLVLHEFFTLDFNFKKPNASSVNWATYFFYFQFFVYQTSLIFFICYYKKPNKTFFITTTKLDRLRI